MNSASDLKFELIRHRDLSTEFDQLIPILKTLQGRDEVRVHVPDCMIPELNPDSEDHAQVLIEWDAVHKKARQFRGRLAAFLKGNIEFQHLRVRRVPRDAALVRIGIVKKSAGNPK